MLDKILAFIATRLGKLSGVTKTQSFTYNNKTFSFRKVGAIVFVDASGDINGIPQGVTNIGTLDADMRPNYTQRYRAANDLAAENRFLGIEPDGKVYLYSSVAKAGATNNSFSGFAFIARGGVS